MPLMSLQQLNAPWLRRGAGTLLVQDCNSTSKMGNKIEIMVIPYLDNEMGQLKTHMIAQCLLFLGHSNAYYIGSHRSLCYLRGAATSLEVAATAAAKGRSLETLQRIQGWCCERGLAGGWQQEGGSCAL